jgi:hypothetical protein
VLNFKYGKKPIKLLSSNDVEMLWYKDYKVYKNHLSILEDISLANFKKDRSALFSYIHLLESPLRRISNSLGRRIRKLLNLQSGQTMGMMNVHCPLGMLNFLNGLALEIGTNLNRKKPFPYLVTSILRTTKHQKHLREIGYPASEFSSHCCGYAADIETGWLIKNRPRAAAALNRIIENYYLKGIINVLTYERLIHICLNPEYISHFEQEGNISCADL